MLVCTGNGYIIAICNVVPYTFSVLIVLCILGIWNECPWALPLTRSAIYAEVEPLCADIWYLAAHCTETQLLAHCVTIQPLAICAEAESLELTCCVRIRYLVHCTETQPLTHCIEIHQAIEQ